MIEIIQDGQATPRIKLPRNLRQIGNPSGEHKIYVEDFVYTFLHPSSREEAGNPKVAIIVGTLEEELKYLHENDYYLRLGVRHGRHACKTDERYGAGAPDEFQRAALAVAVVR